MKSLILILIYLIIYINSQSSQVNCPSSTNSILTSTLKLNLISPSDRPTHQTRIYNYPLLNPFTKIPTIAIGITSLQSSNSPYLMLNIKPLNNINNGLSFLLRFYYRYTTWNYISFNFIAENRQDIQTNYYQLDTQELATNQSGKAIQVVVPFMKNYTSPSVIYFLQGFQIITVPIQANSGMNTPFQIQIITKNLNNSSLKLIISTISSTQIISIILGYIVYQNKQIYQSGFYQYKDFTSINYLNTSLILQKKARSFFGGVTGFVIQNNQGSVKFQVNVNDKDIIFSFRPAAYYVLYQYFSFGEPATQCFYCNLYPYEYNGNCLQSCPQNTTLRGDRCQSQCQFDQKWNGQSCQKLCIGGSIFNQLTNICQCPGQLIWDGQNCIICTNGQIWSQFQNRCLCPQQQFWNNYYCQNIHPCTQNQTFSQETLSCMCKETYRYINNICIKCQTLLSNGTCINCNDNMYYDQNMETCVCRNGLFSQNNCIECTGGRVMLQSSNVCICPINYLWDGQKCILLCRQPFIYLNGGCKCPQNTYLSQNTCKNNPSCQNGKTWYNNRCVDIQCQVGYYWNGDICINNDVRCAPNTYWDGQKCVFYNLVCPNGTNWNGSYCIIKQGDCPMGSYVQNNKCVYFPQLCLPVYAWNGTSCLIVQLSPINCQKNKYFNGLACVQLYCQDGKLWNYNLMQCLCPQTTFWNGLTCIKCPQNHIFTQYGCICRQGYFKQGNSCLQINNQICKSIQNSQWINNHCVCKPGFLVIGLNCICNGMISGDICDLCYNVPNTIMYNGRCQCKNGYYLHNSKCIPLQNNNVTTCQIGTILNTTYKQCVPCSDGCLSCRTSLMCLQCRPEYTYNYNTYSCLEICGDGKRFSLGCDDGNNNNDDGCSSDCKIENQYTCFGGSPNSPDFCTKYIPPSIVINIRGVTHLYGQIIINVMTNYLPFNLTDISKPCDSKCNRILFLQAKGLNAPLSYINLLSEYRKGSHNSFAILINFGKEPIDPFILRVSINPQIAREYFPGVDISKSYDFQINPAYLSILEESQDLN